MSNNFFELHRLNEGEKLLSPLAKRYKADKLGLSLVERYRLHREEIINEFENKRQEKELAERIAKEIKKELDKVMKN